MAPPVRLRSTRSRGRRSPTGWRGWNYNTGDRPLDLHIDVPPYVEKNHLKVALARYVTTSFGIAVIKRSNGR